jgi:hypothetical protein
MKHRVPDRPIGKCKGCCVNSKFRCLGGFQPKEMWRHGRCKHYGDAGLLEAILSKPQPTGAKLAYLERKARATLTATVPHYNGVLDPGKMAGRAKRQARIAV